MPRPPLPDGQQIYIGPRYPMLFGAAITTSPEKICISFMNSNNDFSRRVENRQDMNEKKTTLPSSYLISNIKIKDRIIYKRII